MGTTATSPKNPAAESAGTGTTPSPLPGRPPRRPPRRTALAVVVAIGMVLALLVVVLATRDPSSTRLADSPLLGQPAPALAGPSVLAGGGGDGGDGASFDLAAQQGRWVLVNFFATWCVPCVAEHSDLVRFSAAHAEADDARVVSVVFSDDAEDVARFFAERGGNWPVIDDPVGRVALEFGVTGVPESFLVGPDGSVRAKVVGGVSFERLEDLLAQAAGRPTEPER